MGFCIMLVVNLQNKNTRCKYNYNKIKITNTHTPLDTPGDFLIGVCGAAGSAFGHRFLARGG
jgi:hypothetical protein